MIYDFEKLTFQVLSAGRFGHRKGAYSVSGRPYASIGCRLSGKGRFKIGSKEFVSDVGDILFIAEGESYEVEYTDGESAVIHLTECNYGKSENISAKNDQRFGILFSDVCRNFDGIGKVNYAKAQVYHILQTLKDMVEHEIKDELAQKCIAYADVNFCNADIKMIDICRAANVSEATLVRKFHKYCGMSPKQYLIKKRLDKAVKMLIEGGKTIAEISQCCGFDDPKYMSRMIKRNFGVSPSELKNKYD